jgi:hypothetical protein
MAVNLTIVNLNVLLPLKAVLLKSHILLFGLLLNLGVSVDISYNDVWRPLRAAFGKGTLDLTRELQRNCGGVHIEGRVTGQQYWQHLILGRFLVNS